MSVSLAVVLSYCCMGLTAVAINYAYLSKVFGRPRRLAMRILYALFFVVRFTYDANAYYLRLDSQVDGGSLAMMLALACLWGILSFVVILWTFEGDRLQILTVSFWFNIMTSLMTAGAMAIGNVMTGHSVEGGYFIPFGPAVVIAVLASVLFAYLIRRPTIVVGVWLRDVTDRYRTVFVALMAFFFVTYILYALIKLVHQPFSSAYHAVVVYAICMTLPLVVIQQSDSHEAMVRERMIRMCCGLVASYDQRAYARLALLERDRALFKGSDRVLARLDGTGLDADLRQRIRALEEAYQRVSYGRYCDQPSLDAVLASFAERLEPLGVTPQFTVAGVRSSGLAYAAITLALLNLVVSTAQRSQQTEGELVDLRIRRVGYGALFHLETPATWGRLDVRTFLKSISMIGVAAVSERVVGSRTVVLVLGEDEVT